jgi:hypothetical protein
MTTAVVAALFALTSATPPVVDDAATTTPAAPLLPRHLVEPSNNYWVVGVGIEQFGSNLTASDQRDNQLVGLAARYRISAFGPHALLMTRPSFVNYENTRLLAGLGLRAFYDVRGFTEVSWGFGAHFEVRLSDHYWLGYVTPLELGAVVWDAGSWKIEASIGLRRAFAGALINQILIDPNGLENERARENLYEARHERPWKGFLRLVFGRRID